ncbi:MAG TPA: hypothetical protein VMV53_11960 [Acidimicrobiales bacterium]|nr:hypothetical protein [Acidimicrobiales bacterium]
METTSAERATATTTSPPNELLIREARRRTTRRRRRVGAAAFVVVVASLVLWYGGGGARSSSPLRASDSAPNRAAPGASNSAALAIAGGQSLIKTVSFGPRTLWVETADEMRLTGGAQAIERTSNGGRTWTAVTPPGLGVTGGTHWITAFVALSATRAWLAYGGPSSSAHQILETTSDAGRHWSRVGGLPHAACTLQFTSAADGTCTNAVGAGGSMPIGIYRTSDGGASWRKIFQSGIATTSVAPGSIPFGCDKSIQFESATRGFVFFWCAGGTGAFIYATTSGGVTWFPRDVTAPSPVPSGGGGFGGTPVFNATRGAVPYLAGSYSAVYVTNDGGRSFHPVYPPGKPRTWAVDLISPSRWRLTYGKEILATNNAGHSWFAVASNTVLTAHTYVKGAPPGGLVDFVSANDGWLTEHQYDPNSSLWRTTDGGRHWRRVEVPGTQKR